MNIAITGASGFIGSALTRYLANAGHHITVICRQGSQLPGQPASVIRLNSLSNITPAHLQNIELVIHAAGIAHQQATSAEFQRVNVRSTELLVNACETAGVKRILFLSSVKVNGESTTQAFNRSSALAPEDDYGRSKLAAERVLAAADIPCMILRLPLVYGAGARANFALLVRLVRSRLPLPFAGVTASRSYLALENLVDFVVRAIKSSEPLNQVFYIADEHPLALPELLDVMGQAMGRRVRLFSLPPALLHGLARILVGNPGASKLLGSLEVDISETTEETGWTPPLTTLQAMQRMFGHSG